MGCSKSTENLNPGEISAQLQRLIDLNSVQSLSKLCLESKKGPDINTVIIKFGTLETNPLGYALTKGKLESFKFIYTRMGGLIHSMEEIFNRQGYRSIDLLCMLGHLSVIKFYLPVYISIFIEAPEKISKDPQDSYSFSSSASLSSVPLFRYTPIQHACLSGNLALIKFFVQYFSGKTVPYLFDLDYQNELSGENCALISCKLGNYKLMKFLHEEYKSDFHVLNKCEENALLILSAASNRVDYCEYLMCFRYLLTTIKIDPRYKYEEIVLLLNNHKLLEIFYEALEPYQIFPDKAQIERINAIEYAESNNEDISNFNIISEKNSTISSVKNEDMANTSQFSGISALLKYN